MTDRQKIAIILNHPHRLDDARHCAVMLSKNGAAVAYFCLCRDQCPARYWNIKPILETRMTCFTDDGDLADRYDLECLSAASLVKQLKTADWVIPF